MPRPADCRPRPSWVKRMARPPPNQQQGPPQPARRASSMAIPLGTENKRQVYIVVALFAVILIGGGYELFGPFGGSSTTPPSVATPNPPALQTAAANTRPATGARPTSTSQNTDAADAEKLNNNGLDPTVHFDK